MRSSLYKFILAAAFIVTTAVYWPGLSGTFLFDDYPNIVDNHDVQPHEASLPSLVRVALSSPSSEFKRPLASLSIAANFLATGLDPYWMKLTNLIIHLLNGLLEFLLARILLQSAVASATTNNCTDRIETAAAPATEAAVLGAFTHTDMVAALIAAGWMLLPINLTAVLYVVQRMESMANLFVLLGLIGYVAGRRRMLASSLAASFLARKGWFGRSSVSSDTSGFFICLISITVFTFVGLLAKETAVMLPLYALLIEWTLFQFRSPAPSNLRHNQETSCPSPELPMGGPVRTGKSDRRIITLFLLVLALPMVMGLAWLVPSLLKPEPWATRDFTLGTRLLSESRIVVDYIAWTLMPTPNALSFYHDDFRISTGLLAPWTTLASIVFLAALIAMMLWLRPRRPLAALGIALFLGCHLLTGTILPLELIYEHRNYFASFGLLLAIIPLLAAPSRSSVPGIIPLVTNKANHADKIIATETALTTNVSLRGTAMSREALPLTLPRYALLTGLMLCWATLTALTAYSWGHPLRLAQDLAARAPLSPRAQYELGRTYIIYSNYDPASPFTKLAYPPLERAAALPESSILPEQALIFMNARMKLPLKDAWWNSLITRLKTHKPGVQDESSLAALTECARDHHCELPPDRMTAAFLAALAHPDPSARLLATYGDYAWNVLDDETLGQRMIEEAVRAEPNEPAYRITLVRMLAAQGRKAEALEVLKELELLNIAGRLNDNLAELRALPGLR